MTARRQAWLVPASVAGALALGGCVGPLGPGDATEVERDVPADVTAVRLETSGTVLVQRGEPSLTIVAGDRVVDDLLSDAEDGVLVLDTDRRWFGRLGTVVYRVSLPELEGVTVRGSGDVLADGAGADRLVVDVGGSGRAQVTGVDTSEVSVTVSGSGGVDLSGRTTEQDVEVSGSGGYRGHDLTSERAAVDLSGSGDASVDAAESLRVSVSGSGDVTYAGDPRVDSDVDGSGEVRRLGG